MIKINNKMLLFSCFKIKKIKPNGKVDWHFVYEQDILEKDENWTLQKSLVII